MADANPKVEAFFANAQKLPDELQARRANLKDCPLVEDFKPRWPCYTAQDGNGATVWRLKDACTLAFFNEILMAPGENSRSVRMIQLASVAQISRIKRVLKIYDLWQGKPIRRTRAGDGHITLYGRRLAVHLIVQPGVARDFMADPMAADTGFLPRFLMCEPKCHRHPPAIFDPSRRIGPA